MRFITSVLALVLPLAVLGARGGSVLNAHRRRGNVTVRDEGHLGKRFDGRFTWYDTTQEVQACGGHDPNSAFVVALNSPQYGGGYPGPQCGKKINISCGGKSTIATIRDECPGCPYGGLDLSEGLFKFMASLDVGVLHCTWNFVGGGGGDGGDNGGNNDKAAAKKTTTTAKKVKTTTKPPHTTTAAPKTTTPAPTTTQSYDFNAGPASGLAVPTGTVDVTDTNPQIINQLYTLFVGLGGLAVAASEA